MRFGPGKLKPDTDIEAAAGTASTLPGAINHDIVLDFVRRIPKEINLTSVLESDLSGWLSKQTESISVRGALLPFLKDLLDPLKCYDSSDAFIQALCPHVSFLLGLKIYGWVQNNTVSREEIRGELGQLITVAIKHLHAYRDLYAPEVSAAAEAPSQSYEPARVENQSDRGLQQEAEPSLDQLWDSIDSKLRSQGIEQPLAALVATKTIAALRRHVSIIEQAESTPLYRVKFIESWSGILDVSERFDISPDRILSLGHSRYNSATIAEAYAKQNSVQSDTHIAGFKSTDSRRLLNTAIEDYRANCPSLESHCDETLRNYPNEKQLLAVHLFEMVLYSTTMAVPALEQLNKLQKSLQLSYQNLCDILSNQASEHTKSVVTSIREVGKMTFADYMKLCLYDSEHGYYVRPRNEVIPRTEFITLPEKYTDFGRAVAHDLFQRWKAMGSPQSYDVIEMGAGSGKLACDFLDEIAAKGINDAEWRAFEAAVRYKIVEISARGCSADGARTMRDLQEQTLADHSSKVSWVAATADSLETVFAPASVTGAFISNELPDAFPVHVVRRINGRLCELYVHEQDGYLVEEYGPPSTPEVEAFVEQHGITLREGETGVVNLQAQAWVRSMAAILKEGAIITYDYGATPGFHTQFSSLKSQIRTYGTKRKLSEQRLFGVSGNDVVLGEFEAMMSNLQCKLGRENALAAFADRFTRKQSTDEPAVFDLCEEERHKRTAFFMRELAASALHCPGEVDITTDADFLSMQMQARRSGLEPRAVVTQSEYLQRLSFEANNREIYFENESFRVQVFDKSPVSQPRPRQVSVSYAEEAVLEQNCVTNSIELKTLLELVARADLAGLGKCGELWLAHIKRNGVDSIGVKWGSSLVILLRELAVKAPTGSLVGDLEQYSLSIPKVDPRAPFKEVSEAALQRAIKIRTLGAVIEARLLDAFIDLGYRHISPGADTAILELLSNKPITELEELAYSAEPQASLDRLGALYEAVSIKDPARIEPLRIHDLFSRRDGGVDFDGRKALAPLLPLAGINDFADMVSMVRNLGTHQGPVGVCVDLIANPSLEKFVKVRELLLGVLTDRLAGRLDPLPESVIENTVLGPRSSCIHGNPDAIETQPENTRNIAFIFGRFGAYVGHGLRYGGDKFELRKQTAYLRLLDHSRDAEALQAALKEGEGSRYSDGLHDEKLLRLLLEKGFKKAAEEYVASWRLEDYYFTPEVIELLDAHGLSQAVQRFLSHQRDQLSPRRNNSFSENIELLFDRLSDPEEAAKQFQLEWSHVKTLLRVLCAGKKASSQVGRGRIATREMASACRSGELTINSQDDSWDIFRPDNLPQDRMIIGVNDRIEGDRKYLWQFTSFIRKGLNHETLKGRAIDCIREMAPSLMKLTLLGEASLALPSGSDYYPHLPVVLPTITAL
jgi:SAM-dependent MidA family methyltransferase